MSYRAWAAIGLLGLWWLGDALRGAAAQKLRNDVAPTEALAPVMLGGFKGLAINLLWLRALQLEERREFFELPFLYEMITDLSPEIDEAWAYNSFNMAYNLPNFEGSAEARWRWVRRGLAMIAEGRKRNPHSNTLAHWEAYMIWHLRHRDQLSLQSSQDYYAEFFERDLLVNPERLSTGQASLRVAWESASIPDHPLRADYLLLVIINSEVERAIANEDREALRQWLIEAAKVEQHAREHHPQDMAHIQPILENLGQTARDHFGPR